MLKNAFYERDVLKQRYLLVNIAKFVRTPILQNIGERLHLTRTKTNKVTNLYHFQWETSNKFLFFTFLSSSVFLIILILIAAIQRQTRNTKWVKQSSMERSSRPEVFYKKVFFKISQNSKESTCAKVFFLTRLQSSGL